jgi:tetratricopeptide (TPR) repeat protein
LALRKAGQLEEALADLNQAIGLEPRFARTYADRAKLYRIFRKRFFKLLLLNQSLRRKFVGSRLPTL